MLKYARTRKGFRFHLFSKKKSVRLYGLALFFAFFYTKSYFCSCVLSVNVLKYACRLRGNDAKGRLENTMKAPQSKLAAILEIVERILRIFLLIQALLR